MNKQEDDEGKFYKGLGTIIEIDGVQIALVAEGKQHLEMVFDKVFPYRDTCLDDEKIKEVVIRKSLSGE